MPLQKADFIFLGGLAVQLIYSEKEQFTAEELAISKQCNGIKIKCHEIVSTQGSKM